MLNKYLFPIVAIVGMAVGSAGTVWLTKAVKPIVHLKCPNIPDCNCPKPDPCNGIDFDKIKSRNLTIENKQYITANGDSLVLKKQLDETRLIFQQELAKLKLSRCK